MANQPYPSGTRIGNYEIRELLGSGGAGRTYRAEDVRLLRGVALKILPSAVTRDEEAYRRLLREAGVAATLNHPSIVTIYDVGMAQLGDSREVVPYAAVELIDGETLREAMSRESDGFKLLNYLGQVADAMQYAHAAGVVHRALKPENVMITRDGRVKILDFGIGTFQYLSPEHMSPEQALGKPVDPRSDIFSFGCMVYEALTGHRAFDGEGTGQTMIRVIHNPPPPLPPSIPRALRRVVDRCLAKKAVERFATMRDVGAALKKAALGWDGVRVPSRPADEEGTKRVFILYSRDSPARADQVLLFADALRRHGIDADLDRYHEVPSEGWREWYEEQLLPEASRHVLLVVSSWEGRAALEIPGIERAIPILFDGAKIEDIPKQVRSTVRYRISRFDLDDPGFESLRRDLIEAPGPRAVAPSRLPKAPPLIEREGELLLLEQAWNQETGVLMVIAPSGVGKTALVSSWVERKIPEAQQYFDWSFYDDPSADGFLESALAFFGRPPRSMRRAGEWLAQLISGRRTLLILDGLERLQDPQTGFLQDERLRDLLRGLAWRNQGLCVVTSQQRIADLDVFPSGREAFTVSLRGLSTDAGAALLAMHGVWGEGLKELAARVGGRPLTLNLIAGYLVSLHGGDVRRLETSVLDDSSPSEARLVHRAAEDLRAGGAPWVLYVTTLSPAAISSLCQRAGEHAARVWASGVLGERHAIANSRQILEHLERNAAGTAGVELSIDLLSGADAYEERGRTRLSSFQYAEAEEDLTRAIAGDPERGPRIHDEFGFLFRLGTDPADQARLRWCTSLWHMLTVRLAGEIQVESPEPPPEAPAAPIAAKAETVRPGSKSPQAKGKELEEAVLRLFRRFFAIAEDDEAALRVQLKKLRSQKAGSQYGYDLAFEAAVAEQGSVRCHVECKNYSSPVALKDVADKLLQQKSHGVKIDHWILISPNADPANDLDHFLKYESHTLDFPFDIHVWSPETGVDQFFALEPLLYERFYPKAAPSTQPQSAIVDRYRSLLRPVYRLPPGWKEYVENGRHLCFSDSERLDFERTYSKYVALGVKDQNGVELSGTSIERITAWLAEPSPRVAFVLGEFGDGKSFLTYSLCRELLQSFRAAPEWGVIPIRLALREFKAAGSVREFLQARLEMFGADPAGWAALKRRHRTLVILDGFDEISKELDPRTITENIRALIDCCTATVFDGSKILITSRTHFFETGDASRLLQRLDMPLLLQLGRIPRAQVLGHLQEAAKGPQERELLQKLSRMHDPIGLGTKPLFLQMLKDTLHELPADLDEVSVYESYARRSLERKIEMLDDPEVRSVRGESIEQLLGALGIIAVELQRSSDSYVSLKNLPQVTGRCAEHLWNLTGDDVLESDAEARLGTRSLLSRVKALEGEGQWLVDFCHRSIREYFVARRFAGCLNQGPAEAAEFLGSVPVNHEILYFAACLVRRGRDEQALRSLRELIAASKAGDDAHGVGGKALTVLLRVAPALPRDLDYRQHNFDYADLEDGNLSGLDFSGSTFRSANFANANIEHANLSHCDLTDVRLHETTSVLAVAAPSSQQIFAAYEDGTIWEWDLGSGGKPAGRIVFAQHGLRLSRLGVTRSGIPWAIAGRETLLFDRSPAEWRCMARIPLRQRCSDFHVDERNIAVLLAEQNSRCLLADLEQQTFAVEALMPESPAFVSPMPGVLCFRSGETSVRVIGERLDCEIEVGNATSLHAASGAGGEILIAAGDRSGVLRIFALSSADGQAEVKPLFAEPVHSGPILSVMFCDGEMVASGGLDRRITLTPFFGDGSPRRNLQLSLRCTGLNTTALKPDSQRKRLEELKLRMPEA